MGLAKEARDLERENKYDDAFELAEEARKLEKNGKYDEAIELILNYLDQNPQYKTIDYYHFANPIEEILFNVYIEDIDSVKTLNLEECLELIYFTLARAYGKKGDKEKEEKYLKIANKINPVSAIILLRLCKYCQSINENEKIKELAPDIMKYSYNSKILIESYLTLAFSYLDDKQEKELYNHLMQFYLTVETGTDFWDSIKEDIKYLEEHEIQVGFNPEMFSILKYLIALHTKQGREDTAKYFKDILYLMEEFTKSLNELRYDS
ncbi:TPR repeat-containing protein [Methanobrevibacter ruminantium M1]|uniref:TPR repeat-containing protein n=1 Tax=Methanobrevibacter ruminantium (strain ATCC 35063 / DSM 1093 / JCM 13430 / OCM 146 / M1) TaxID=634498 RepID=D3E238_METRM|nr:hypothetical protein [Methanobrevibacter ruminantium]ADC46599.1 TPR repeat-containing protein [Methanobrevibacter ruminantium M1]